MGLRVALSARLAENRLIVVDSDELATVKTKDLKTNMASLKIDNFVFVGDLKVRGCCVFVCLHVWYLTLPPVPVAGQ